MEFEIFVEMNNGQCLHSEVIEAESLEAAEQRAAEIAAEKVRWGATELSDREDPPIEAPFIVNAA